MNTFALIGIGTNVEPRGEFLRRALDALAAGMTIVAESSVYESAAVGPASAPFLNLAVVARTSLAPAELLAFIKNIEAMLGRRYRDDSIDREIDIDILAHDATVLDSPSLAIPHPRMLARPFVLVPLAEIVPRWRHPVARATYAELVALLPENGPGQILRTLPAVNPERRIEARSLKNETPRFSLEDLNRDPAAVGNAFLRHGRIVLTGAIEPELLAALGNEILALLAAPEKIPRERYRENDAADGYTPPAVEHVRGYAPDPMRHFWDVAAAGGKLPQTPRSLALALREILASAGHCLLAAIDSVAGTAMAADAEGADNHLRIAHYLNDECGGDIIFPSHLDWNSLTLHLGGSGDGMEILDDETWVGTDADAGDILVFPGSVMKIYDPALPKPLRHRVRALVKNRVSMILWMATRGDIVLPNGERADARELRLMRQMRADAKEKTP